MLKENEWARMKYLTYISLEMMANKYLFKPKPNKQKTLADLLIRPVLKEILKGFLHDPNRCIEITD